MKKLLVISISLLIISLAPQISFAQELPKDFNVAGDVTYEKLIDSMNFLIALQKNESHDYPPLLTVDDVFLEVVHLAKDIREGISDYKGDVSFMNPQGDNYYVKELTKISAEVLMRSMFDDGLKEVEQKSADSESYFYKTLGFIQLTSNYLTKDNIERYTTWMPRDILEKREITIRRANTITKNLNVPTYLDFAGKFLLPGAKLDLSNLTREDVKNYFQNCISNNKIFLYAGVEDDSWFKPLARSRYNKRFIKDHTQNIRMVTLGKDETLDQAYQFNNMMVEYLMLNREKLK